MQMFCFVFSNESHLFKLFFSLQLFLPRHPAAERQRSSPFAVNKFLRQCWKLSIGRKLRKINCLCMLTLLWCFFKSSFHTSLSVQTSTCCLTHSMSFLERVELCSNSLVCQILSWLSDSLPGEIATKWSTPLPWTKLKTFEHCWQLSGCCKYATGQNIQQIQHV